jgi:hypothetical protein|tara:strand:+ start:827 stop:1123 length:297 start_codon:yes stop_codon:yes gene_type:complete
MDICSAILKINPSAEVSVNAEDLDQITYHNGTAVISKADIVAKQAELKTAYDALDYSRKRKTAYDELNQYELMYDDKVNSTDKWGEAITAIKNKFPKG